MTIETFTSSNTYLMKTFKNYWLKSNKQRVNTLWNWVDEFENFKRCQ